MGRDRERREGKVTGLEETAALEGGAVTGVEETVAATEGGAAAATPGGDRSPDLALARGETVGRYVVLDLLGKGGMGEVYAAFDPELDRKIALKVLHPALQAADASIARARLTREAQAMAQLAHPNVIQVFDVGTTEGGDVYVAMEFVEGSDLREWVGAGDRGWREILAAFCAAGRGLAAAHDAGLVHRDFKPDNVLLGDDGRVRVIDFGIARLADGEDDATREELVATMRESRQATTSDFTTRTGAAMGTPAYMAPEQFSGAPTDARTDQFNFAVALHEALYGQRPFEGSNVSELFVNVTSGSRRAPPSDTAVPAWVQTSIEKALSIDPEERYRSMSDFLAALEPRVQTRRRWPLVLAAALAAAAVSVPIALMTRSEPASPCTDQDRAMTGVWDDERKQAMRAAFLATEVPYAAQTWSRVEKTLDDYATDWARLRTESCKATNVHKEQSAELLDRSMACFDRTLHELDAVVTVLASADDDVVKNAAQAATSLTPLAECVNRGFLARAGEDELSPAQREVQGQLARVKALDAAGKYPDALDLAAASVAAARETSWPLGEARAMYWQSKLQSRLGRDAEATETAFAAIRVAERAGDPVCRAQAWSAVTAHTAQNLDRPTEALRWAKHAEIAIEQAGDDLSLLADLHSYRGSAYFDLRDYDRSIEEFRAASALYEKLYGAHSWQRAFTTGMIGSSLRNTNRFAEAAEEQELALDIALDVLGSEHPRIAALRNNFANTLSRMQRFSEAREQYERAREIRESTLGPEHPSIAIYELNLGTVAEKEGDFERALEHVRAGLALRERALGTEHASTIRARSHLSRVLHKQGDLQRAAALQRDVVVRYGQIYGDADPRVADAHTRQCWYMREMRRFDAGARHCAAALAIHGDAPRDPRNLAWALSHFARLEVDMGKASSALERAEKALAIYADHPTEPEFLAEAELAAARALVESGGDRERAHSLTEAARRHIEEAPPGNRQLAGAIDATLANL